MVIVQKKGMLVIIGIHLSAPFIKKEVANLGISVRSRILNRLEANQTSKLILWQSPKHWRSRKYFADVQSESGLQHGVLGIPVNSIYRKSGNKLRKSSDCRASHNAWFKSARRKATRWRPVDGGTMAFAQSSASD